MQVRKRAVVYSGLVIVVALILSVALLQFGASSTVHAVPAPVDPPLTEFSLTIIKDAVPDSTQPFTFVVIIQPNEERLVAAADAIEAARTGGGGGLLVDDGSGVSNTMTITTQGYATQALGIVLEAAVDNWRPTGVQCQDEAGLPVTFFVTEAPRFPQVSQFLQLPMLSGKQYTCTFTNGTPAIALTKTVGTDLQACTGTHAITVVEGTEVNYCYTVKNTGGLPLTIHSLEDDQLGTLLDHAAYVLAPDASTVISMTATPLVTTTNVATWTASMNYQALEGFKDLGAADADALFTTYTLTAVATDTATVNVEPPDPSIAVIKTVGTQPGVCATSASLEVKAGATVYYCYTVQNTGNVPLPLHSLQDSDLGEIFTGFAYDLAPGSSVNTVQANVTVSKTVDVAVTNVATWTAYAGNSITAQSVTGVDAAVVTLEPTGLGEDDAPQDMLFLPQVVR